MVGRIQVSVDSTAVYLSFRVSVTATQTKAVFLFNGRTGGIKIASSFELAGSYFRLELYTPYSQFKHGFVVYMHALICVRVQIQHKSNVHPGRGM